MSKVCTEKIIEQVSSKINNLLGEMSKMKTGEKMHVYINNGYCWENCAPATHPMSPLDHMLSALPAQHNSGEDWVADLAKCVAPLIHITILKKHSSYKVQESSPVLLNLQPHPNIQVLIRV